MAKSSRSKVKKENNRRLKTNVFGPVEAARNERMSARLLEVASQPKPERNADDEMKLEGEDSSDKKGKLHPSPVFHCPSKPNFASSASFAVGKYGGGGGGQRPA